MNLSSLELMELVRRLMECPTAPYHEAGVRAVAEAIARENGLHHYQDRFGNLFVRTGNRGRPLVLAAHLDHPGFAVLERIDALGWAAEFLGGVGEKYFVPGVPLRLHPGNVAGRLGKQLDQKRRIYRLETEMEVQEAMFAVWDLPSFECRGPLIYGRACDDLIGVAVALATLIELQRQGVNEMVYAVLTRAEEVGFGGALAVAKHRLLPKDSLVVSLETSRELPPVLMGQGVIVRTGDKASVFDSRGTRYLTEISHFLAAENPDFKFQRALMPGGTCEATAYQEFGYASVAVCVALGNYHNCGAEQIAEEFVHGGDVESMVRLLVKAAVEFPSFLEWANTLRDQFIEYSLQTEPRLLI